MAGGIIDHREIIRVCWGTSIKCGIQGASFRILSNFTFEAVCQL